MITSLTDKLCPWYRGKAEGGALSWDNLLTLQNSCLSLDTNQVWGNEEEVNLADTEYHILRLLMRHPNRIFSAQSIYETVWKEPYLPLTNGTVTVHIRNLRTKAEADPQQPEYIKNVWGKGYRFEVRRDEA